MSATALRPGPSGTLITSVQVSTSGQPSDQLDAVIAAGGAPVAVYHQRVNVGEIPDLAGCGGAPPPGMVDHWLHYGPLLVPGRSGVCRAKTLSPSLSWCFALLRLLSGTR